MTFARLNGSSEQESEPRPVTVLVLAGARPGRDPVAEAVGVSNKVLAPVGGIPMVARVLKTLEASYLIAQRVLCGPSWEVVQEQTFLRDLVEKRKVRWMVPQQGPSLSVKGFLEQFPEDLPLLVTTADHALLTVEMVDHFLREANRAQVDVAVALVPYSVVAKAYPQSKRTVIGFRGGGYCGCNVFLLSTPKARQLVEFWIQVEQERKRPLRLIRRLGWSMLIRYALGVLSLADALSALNQRMGLSIKEIILPFPEAAIDVDTPEDLVLVEQILEKRERSLG
jgi:GTP:adenosylcobinamide-phosphate guanylyltransferase